MKKSRQNRLEDALRQSWRRGYPIQDLKPRTREMILAQVAERGNPGRVGFLGLLELTPAVNRFAWAAAVLALLSGLYGVKMLDGVATAANYMACFFLA